MKANKIIKIKEFLNNESCRFTILNRIGFYKLISDENYVKRKFRLQMGVELNLDNPKTYNEKLQWLKLNDRKDIYTTMVDKAEANKIVASVIGIEYTIPVLGVWDFFDEINFDSLPDQFVLKCTHDSGSIQICRNKKIFDKKEAKRRIEKCQKRNYYWHGREWPYKNVKPRIIAEAFLEDQTTHDLRDYKFFAFDGVVKALYVVTDREKTTETKFDFFDADFHHLPFTQGHPNADMIPKKPDRFEEMKGIASKLSRGIPHVRVDLYEANGKIYFGEFTFFHWNGMVPFNPPEWDRVFGEWIKLPKGQCCT